jgi:hypothetical protein
MITQLPLPLRGVRLSRRNRHLCRDCQLDTIAHGHYYVVDDALWASTGLGPHGGMLCLPCLERRIGRKLRLEDFTAIIPRAFPVSDEARAAHERALLETKSAQDLRAMGRDEAEIAQFISRLRERWAAHGL